MNRSGAFDDTASIVGVDSGTTAYSKWTVLSGFEAMRVIFKVDDTTAAGFADDSLALAVGYQTGTACLGRGDSATNMDTCPDVMIVLDTILTANLGNRGATVGAATSKVVDTVACYGWAVLPKYLAPSWDNYIRFWARGDAGHCQTAVKIRVDLQRRQFINVRYR